MFSVIFEVNPKPDQWDAYLGYARLLRPELVQVEGFIDNVRYRSLRRPGWVLSLSTWRDEKALIRWRTASVHHDVQQQGRAAVFGDYHLRVGQITDDNQVPPGHAVREQRLDETETGVGKVVSIIEATRPGGLPRDSTAESIAARFGLLPASRGLVDWDVFESILDAANLLLLCGWESLPAASAAEAAAVHGARVRRVRVIRDYGMYDRREAPQFYPPVCSASARPAQ